MKFDVGDLVQRGEHVLMVMEIGEGYYVDYLRCWVLNGTLEEHWMLVGQLEPL